MNVWIATDVARDRLLSVRPGLDADFIASRLRSCLAAGMDWFVVCYGEDAAGWVVVHWNGKLPRHRDPFLEDLFVREDWRSRGIGSALIGHVEELVQQRGLRRFGLSVDPNGNPRALALYDRLGFVHDGGEPYLDGVYDGVEEWVIDLYKEW